MRVNLKASSQFTIHSSQFPVPSNKSQVPNPKFYPLIFSQHQEEILKMPRSGNGTAMGNLENHRRLSASVYGSLPHPGANESVLL